MISSVHKRTLDLVHMCADVVEDRRHTRAGEVERCFSNGLRARHFAKSSAVSYWLGAKATRTCSC